MGFTQDGFYHCMENPDTAEVFIETTKVTYANLPLQCTCRQCPHTSCEYHTMQRELIGQPQQTILPHIEFVRPKDF